MKKMALCALITAAVSLPAAAAETEQHTGKKLLIFTGTTIAGAALGGPLGMFAGAISGAYLGESVERSYQLDDVKAERESTVAQLSELREALAASERRNQDLAATALQGLHFELLFHTGESALDHEQQLRLSQLASWMNAHPEWRVVVAGHADPRGGEGYNQQLSVSRATSVADLLAQQGVEPHRIQQEAYGESHSRALSGDLDGYALERRVAIELIHTSPENEVAQLGGAHQ